MHTDESGKRRDARRRLAHLECYLANLRRAQAHRAEIAAPSNPDELACAFSWAYSCLDSLRSEAQGSLRARRRPRVGSQCRPATAHIFLDECGSPRLVRSADSIGCFSLTAIVVRDEVMMDLQEAWDGWKYEFYGTTKVKLRASDILRGRGAFWFDGDTLKRDRAATALGEVISKLDFKMATVIVRREAYLELFGHAGMDSTLPNDIYHMALDFLCERLVMGLHLETDDRRGQLVAESRGPKEDALLQYEFARLLLYGTSYVPDTWFRHQLLPGIKFETKDARLAGLELADILGRSCVEKVMAPTVSPLWWREGSPKLFQSRETKNSPLGMKIVPWADEYDGLWVK